MENNLAHCLISVGKFIICFVAETVCLAYINDIFIYICIRRLYIHIRICVYIYFKNITFQSLLWHADSLFYIYAIIEYTALCAQ